MLFYINFTVTSEPSMLHEKAPKSGAVRLSLLGVDSMRKLLNVNFLVDWGSHVVAWTVIAWEKAYPWAYLVQHL